MAEELKVEKINDYKWIIPKVGEMRVPGVLFISEKLLKKAIEDKAIEQVANVAKLPGIVKYSLAMPDVHWGYGAPIGGVGAFNEESGVIVPGFVGYDINCLSKNTKILTDYGYYLNIEDFETLWRKVITYDTEKKELCKKDVLRFIKQKRNGFIYSIKTEAGFEIKVTEEHPLFTLNGKKEAKSLEIGDNLIIYPFEGVPFLPPSDEVIVDEVNFKKILKKFKKGKKGNAEKQIINILKKKNLLPLKFSSPALPKILKIIGYLFGDGSISYLKKTNEFIVLFYGKKEDMIDLKNDIEAIGFKTYLYTRKRKNRIKTEYNFYEFESETSVCQTSSRSFALLLISLGVPYGNKVEKKFYLPDWILKASLWQKRLFLASFFGAEMSTPKLMPNGFNFYTPTISLNKKAKYVENGIEFLRKIEQLCREFEVNIKKISVRETIGNKVNIRMIFSSTIENLKSLYGKIGFEYNREKQHLSNLTLFYLKKKEKVIKERNEVEKLAVSMKMKGNEKKEIVSLLETNFVNKRFIERSLYEGRRTNPRISFNFNRFFEFKEKIEEKLGKSGFVYDKIEEIKKLPYSDYVYDLTVFDKNHNFVANNFLVSNCGVRLIRTNLTRKDIEDKIQDLLNGLFYNIPSGVGSTGKLALKRKQLEELIVKGAKWAVENGYGKKEDLENIEEYGCMEGADPSVISDRAYERGLEQTGTLGSGNHFLEIQQVIHIYDEKIAEKFGLFVNQITIMVHTGSRGFGYQICDEFLDMFGKVVHKYGIKLPDRQLACAPCNSPEGQKYFKAMKAAANYAFANRQMIYYWICETFEKILNIPSEKLGIETVYDVAHNICKFETHDVNGNKKRLYVHRKGATRAFPKGHSEIPEKYRDVGQPVIIPGTMGTASYVLVGTEKAMEETFGSTCHGAGRMLSRSAAIKQAKGRSISKELLQKGVIPKAVSEKGLAEEMPEAYKDVDEVIKVVEGAGISKKVAKMIPIGVIKG